VNLPPLRERKEDIPLLVDHFLKKFSEKMNKNQKEISMAAMQKLLSYAWPGNVRELENTIEYAVAMSTKDIIDQDLILQTSAPEDAEELKSFKDAKNHFEKNYISNLLSLAEGNVSKAAKLAGKYRGDLYALMKKHDLDPTVFKKE
ncbi:MAG: two-component system response regulator GlrR, partial [Deltaproteobacteria bacterium]|nr:two-component system response regulator GlrR [Deltaproteobacteria bacterium]